MTLQQNEVFAEWSLCLFHDFELQIACISEWRRNMVKSQGNTGNYQLSFIFFIYILHVGSLWQCLQVYRPKHKNYKTKVRENIFLIEKLDFISFVINVF